MSSGVTNLMRNIRPPAPQWLHKHHRDEGADWPFVSYVNHEKDRTLRGKARRRARRNP